MYMFHPKAPERIHRLLPKVKIIVLLRDPAERAIAQICHAIQRDFENLDPSAAIEAEDARLETGNTYSLQKHSYISRSKYLEQLDRYEGLFDKNQILVLKSEDLFIDQSQSWEKLNLFLGLEEEGPIGKFPKENQRQKKELGITAELRGTIRRKLMDTAEGVRERYGFGWDWA